MRAAAELRLHPHDQVEQLFALNDLRYRLSANGRGDHGFYVGNIDSVARDLVPIDIHQQTRLAEFAHYRKFGKSRNFASVFLIWIALS